MNYVQAYFIGGPQDLTKKQIDGACESFRWPSREVSFKLNEDRPSVKCHHYRRVGMITEEIAIFYYEGTW